MNNYKENGIHELSKEQMIFIEGGFLQSSGIVLGHIVSLGITAHTFFHGFVAGFFEGGERAAKAQQ